MFFFYILTRCLGVSACYFINRGAVCCARELNRNVIFLCINAGGCKKKKKKKV